MDAAPAARLYLDREIAPSRSLPPKGFAILMGVFIALNLSLGLLFLHMGAAPVPIFLGLDVAAVSIAFAANYRHGRRRERVQVSAEQVRVLREQRGRLETVWESPSAFTRVALEQTGGQGLQVRLSVSGRRLTVGAVLGPLEREHLAEALQAAIHAARAERHSS